MPQTIQKAMIENYLDLENQRKGFKTNVHRLDVEFLVDPNALRLALPLKIIELLDLKFFSEKTFTVESEKFKRRFYSPLRITIGERDTLAEVMEIPAELNQQPKFGSLILNALELMVDNENHALVPTPHTKEKFVIDFF